MCGGGGRRARTVVGNIWPRQEVEWGMEKYVIGLSCESQNLVTYIFVLEFCDEVHIMISVRSFLHIVTQEHIGSESKRNGNMRAL